MHASALWTDRIDIRAVDGWLWLYRLVRLFTLAAKGARREISLRKSGIPTSPPTWARRSKMVESSGINNGGFVVSLGDKNAGRNPKLAAIK